MGHKKRREEVEKKGRGKGIEGREERRRDVIGFWWFGVNNNVFYVK